MTTGAKLQWDGGWSFAFLVFLVLILLIVGFGFWFFPWFFGVNA